jgi:capsular polysaccharide transport system ATP-binding protein
MTMRHGWREVLHDINIDLPSDKNLGILGRNGAGKSTLMRLLSGLDLPDKGQINTGGRRLSWPLGAGGGVHGSLTGRENIKFICRIYNKDVDETTKFVQDFAELGDYMYMPVNTYSAGMKSRLGFGISMSVDFDTYLIDEGFSAGDARFQQKTQEIFKEKTLKANMIVVSHSAATIRKFCNAAGILKEGKLTLFDDVEEAIKSYNNLW